MCAKWLFFYLFLRLIILIFGSSVSTVKEVKMKVQPILVGPNEYNYILIGNDGLPIEYPAKYMKYLHGTQKSPETRRTYCIALKYYYTFLELTNHTEGDANLKLLSDFVGWLAYPTEFGNVTGIHMEDESSKAASTIDLYLTAVASFYRFLYVTYQSELNLDESIYTLKQGPRQYKDFLYHVTKRNPNKKNMLKIKLPKERTKRLSESEIENCLKSTTNIRDRFLLYLLLTTGLRIGEALSLQHEDIFQDKSGCFKIHIANRRNNPNKVYNKTGSREILMNQECLDLYDDYCFYLECNSGINSDYVFVKIKGSNSGTPLDKPCIYSLFRKLKAKTGIDVHPHLFRSTYGSILYAETKDIEFTRESLGHSSVQTTINAYVRTTDDEVLEQWSKVKDKFITKGDSDNE